MTSSMLPWETCTINAREWSRWHRSGSSDPSSSLRLPSSRNGTRPFSTETAPIDWSKNSPMN